MPISRWLLACAAVITISEPAALAATAGITAAVNQSAQGRIPGGTVRTIAIGETIIQNERIDTGDEGLVQILLADGTAFTVGPNASIVIDRFVYDPQAGTAQVAASLSKGVFRFIGGRTSKTPGGVRLETPIGTAGIRGAVADIEINADGSGRIGMVFGDEVTLTTRAGRERIFLPGYSVVVGRDGQSRVVRTPPTAASAIQIALAGKPGTSGGSTRTPSEEVVLSSPLPAANSQRQVALNSPPLPTPRPTPATDLSNVASEAGRDVVRGEIVAAGSNAPPPVDPEPEPDDPGIPVDPEPQPEPEPQPPVDPDPGPDNPDVPVDPEPQPQPEPDPQLPVEPDPGPDDPDTPVDPQPEPGTPLRVMRSPDAAGASRGIVGGAPQYDDTTLFVPSGESTLEGETAFGVLRLPILSDASPGELSQYSVAPESASVSTDDGIMSLGGVAFAGADSFRAYFVQNVEMGALFYALGGTPAPSGVFAGTGVRTYSFTRDLETGLRAPFLSPEIIGDWNAIVSPIQIAESGDTPRLFQSWIAIEGTGEYQRSGVGVNAGTLANGAFAGSRAGSYRDQADGSVMHMIGGIATLAGPDGGEFFGTNADYFAISSDFDDPEAVRRMQDVSADPADGLSEPFSTTHVGVISAVDEEPDRSFSGHYAGYAASALRTTSDETTNIYLVRTGQSYYAQEGLQSWLDFDAEDLTVRGQIAINEGETSVAARFDEERDPTAFVNDAVFGASSDRLSEEGLRESSYMVSGRSIPDVGDLSIFEGTDGPCECKFLQWGWWGTLQEDGPADAPAGTRSVHLGTFATGDITSEGQLTDLLSNAQDQLETTDVVATYDGHAIGTVQAGDATYAAAGDMSMTWNFAQRSGSWSLENFDGRDLGAVPIAEGTTSHFAGQSNSEAGAVSVDGSFVNSPGEIAKGAIGGFDASVMEEEWRAVGTFAGERGALSSPDL